MSDRLFPPVTELGSYAIVVWCDRATQNTSNRVAAGGLGVSVAT